MITDPYAHYKRMQVDTASQGRLIIMLYDGALKNLHCAKNTIAGKDIKGTHHHLMKTQDIIRELNVTLNMNVGDMAFNLRKLYIYILNCLVKANVSKDIEKVEEVIALLSTLREAWVSIILKK